MSKKLNIIEAMKMPIGTQFNIEIGKTENTPGFTFTKIAIKLFGQTKAFYNLETDKPLSLFEEYLNATFIPIQQPVSFMEVVNSNKCCKVKYENCDTQFNEGFKCLDTVLYFLSFEYPPSTLREIIKNGKWYIEESEELEDERLSK